MSDIRTITVLTPCYNEAENVRALYERVRAVFQPLAEYTYEHLFIDNASTDETVAILREIAARDQQRQGHRQHAQLRPRPLAVPRAAAVPRRRGDRHGGRPAGSAGADSGVSREVARRLQGRPRRQERERGVGADVRDPPRSATRVIDRLSEVKQVRNSTGFGLYDKAFVSVLRRLPDPYPYFRGIVAELGFRYATVPYTQPKRTRGITKNNLYTLYDLGVQGIVNHSQDSAAAGDDPRVLSARSSSLLAALVYFVMKMLFWYNLPIGVAPLIIGLFCVASVQLFFLGVLGEYVGSIYTQVRNRPLVVEAERINFERRDRGLTQGTGDSSRPAAGGRGVVTRAAVNRHRGGFSPACSSSIPFVESIGWRCRQHCRRRLDRPVLAWRSCSGRSRSSCGPRRWRLLLTPPVRISAVDVFCRDCRWLPGQQLSSGARRRADAHRPRELPQPAWPAHS